jgi:uncharacterized protein (DUF1501 family)
LVFCGLESEDESGEEIMTTPSRREFLATGAAVALSSAPAWAAAVSRSSLSSADAIILINLIGGPSQLDTWDPKPEAPLEVRGPFAPIRTRVPGLLFSELFPRMAAIADRFSVIRSVYHDAPPVHEAGLQILNTGLLFRDAPLVPHLARQVTEDWVSLSPLEPETGLTISRGQNPDGARVRPQPFTSAMEEAVREVERGTRFILINQFDTVFDQPSWDCHAAGGSLASSLRDYQQTVAPEFDQAYSRLILQLEERGLLKRTLVLAAGEFGRTPYLNSQGGRDHSANCWTVLLAGGGVRGGQVLGASDRWGGEPSERPIPLADLPATLLAALGKASSLGQPVRELF